MKILNVLLAAAALVLAAPALAGHGKHKDKGAHGAPAFSAGERDEIRGYFNANPQAREQLPPGLAKKGKIPPGWQKKLAVGGRVPDDVWEHRVPLPREIEAKLPPPPAGVINVRINDRIVRVAERTREVLDVFDILSGRSGPPR